MKKNFVEELKWRGMLAQMMPGTEELLQKEMASPSALRTSPCNPCWWCHRYDWRPLW